MIDWVDSHLLEGMVEFFQIFSEVISERSLFNFLGSGSIWSLFSRRLLFDMFFGSTLGSSSSEILEKECSSHFVGF